MQRPQPLPADAARETEQLLRGEDTAEEGGCCGVVACLGGMGQLGIVDALLHSEPEPPPIGVSAKPLQSDRSRANMINDWLTVKDDHTGSVVRPPYTHSLPDSTVVKGSRVDREARFIFLFSWFVTNLATTVHTGTTSCVKRTRQLGEYMGLSEYSILLLASSVGIYSTPLLESMALLLIAVNYSHRQHLEAILVARVAAGALHEEVDPISGERIYVETAPVDHPARRRCWTLAAETMDDYKSAGGCDLNFEAMEAAARKDPLGCMAFVLHLLPSSSGGREAIAFAGNPSDIAHGRILAAMMRAKYEVLMNKAYSSEVALQEHLDVIAKAVRETPVPDFAAALLEEEGIGSTWRRLAESINHLKPLGWGPATLYPLRQREGVGGAKQASAGFAMNLYHSVHQCSQAEGTKEGLPPARGLVMAVESETDANNRPVLRLDTNLVLSQTEAHADLHIPDELASLFEWDDDRYWEGKTAMGAAAQAELLQEVAQEWGERYSQNRGCTTEVGVAFAAVWQRWAQTAAGEREYRSHVRHAAAKRVGGKVEEAKLYGRAGAV